MLFRSPAVPTHVQSPNHDPASTKVDSAVASQDPVSEFLQYRRCFSSPRDKSDKSGNSPHCGGSGGNAPKRGSKQDVTSDGTAHIDNVRGFYPKVKAKLCVSKGPGTIPPGISRLASTVTFDGPVTRRSCLKSGTDRAGESCFPTTLVPPHIIRSATIGYCTSDANISRLNSLIWHSARSCALDMTVFASLGRSARSPKWVSPFEPIWPLTNQVSRPLADLHSSPHYQNFR
jgi:hypothetical protein